MAYGTIITAVFDALITKIQSCSSFSTTNATGKYYTSWQGVTYPVVMIRPLRDVFLSKMIGYKISPQDLTFRIEIKNTGTGTKANINTMISLVGEIVDAIEAEKNLGAVANTNLICTIRNIDYSLERSKSAIFYHAFITVLIKLQREI